MKKFLCIAVFSIAIMANATETKEIVENNSEEATVEKCTSEKEIVANNFKEVKGENNLKKETSEDDMFFGCGSLGNSFYNELRALKISHRDARRARRIYVRDCRGGTWAWIEGPWND